MAQLVRVFTSAVPPAAPIPDQSFIAGVAVRVHIDAEEQPGVIDLAGTFTLVVVVTNRTTSTVVPAPGPVGTTPASGVAAIMGTPAWPITSPNRRFVYDIPAAIGPIAGEIFEVLVCLKVGAGEPFETYFASTNWIRT